jgi:hypothetical protein
MSLRYFLLKNKLKTSKNNYLGRVTHIGRATEDNIIDLMISRGSTVSKAEALAVLEEYSAALEELLYRGYHINTSLIKVKFKIKGTFREYSDKFDPDRHELSLIVQPGTRLDKVHTKISLNKVRPTMRMPSIRKIVDFKTLQDNTVATAGNLIALQGRLLDFDTEDSQQGCFFVKNGEAVRADQIIHNKPSEILLMVPDGLSGIYYIELRKLFQRCTNIKKTRFDKQIEVVVPS